MNDTRAKEPRTQYGDTLKLAASHSFVSFDLRTLISVAYLVEAGRSTETNPIVTWMAQHAADHPKTFPVTDSAHSCLVTAAN